MIYDLLGVGAGPFNLSLLSLLQKTELKTKLLERAPEIRWHSELIFQDSIMQTSFLKDLVTSVDPTSPYSFLNYLVSEGLFYLFMNTNRTVVSRREYERYLQFVASKLEGQINFNGEVESIKLSHEKTFSVQTKNDVFKAKALCLANGMSARIPEFARNHLGANCFHAKSPALANLDMANKNIVIIGGGQTGIEIFRNALNHQWGEFKSLRILSRRSNLLPLDESPFTNEYFTPNYVHCFYKLDQDNKTRFLNEQRMAGDGNTPQYLHMLYNDLFQKKVIEKDSRTIEIMPNRKVTQLTEMTLAYENQFTHKSHELKADIIILATGFEQHLPAFLTPLLPHLEFDEKERLKVNENFSLVLKGQGPNSPKIFVQNYSKHQHGISEPQTSLMPWRSATIVNALAKKTIYSIDREKTNFINFCRD